MSLFLRRKAKLIVVACNTSTVFAIDFLRKKFSLPFVGLEPSIKPAAKMTKEGSIGVLVTKKTAESKRQRELIENFAQGKRVISIDCSELTPLIEEGKVDSKETIQVLEKYLLPLRRKNIDVLVLGCTHYPFLKKQIQNIIGLKVRIVDSGKPVARQVKKLLEENDLLSNQEKGKKAFFTTGNAKKFQTLSTNLLGFQIKTKEARL